MIENRLNKKNVWMHLLNFSKNGYLNSEYFHDALVQHIDFTTPQGKEALKKTQRELAKIINELISDLRTLDDKRRIVSSDKGYKIAVTPEEIEDGWRYLYSKVDEVLQRVNWLKSGYNEMVHQKTDKQTQDLFA